jgi:hypothetical protein
MRRRVGVSECSVAILDQAFDSNTGTAEIMSAASSSADAPVARAMQKLNPVQMLGGGADWEVPPPKRHKEWEGKNPAYKESKVDHLVTTAMDRLLAADQESGFKNKHFTVRKAIIKESNKVEGAGLSRKERVYASTAMIHNIKRHKFEDYWAGKIRDEAKKQEIMVETQKEMELLRMGVSANGPKFRVGQSVHQWWAPWFWTTKEGEMPKKVQEGGQACVVFGGGRGYEARARGH